MSYPRVEHVSYRLVESADLEFASSPAVAIDTPEFRGQLSDGLLTLEPKLDFPTEEAIRLVANAFVRAWEISAGLSMGRPSFRRRYEGAAVVNEPPDSPDRNILVSDTVHVKDELAIKLTPARYPSPPAQFKVTLEVEVIWDRFCRYLAGNEPLLSMAYFCLTFLERGNRRGASTRLDIEFDILDELGELSSTRGGPGGTSGVESSIGYPLPKRPPLPRRPD